MLLLMLSSSSAVMRWHYSVFGPKLLLLAAGCCWYRLLGFEIGWIGRKNESIEIESRA